MSHGRFLMAAAFLAALVLAAILLLTAQLPIGFSRPCRLVGQAEWLLLKTGPDTFEARLLDRRNGNQQQFDLFRFERGDFVHFTLTPEITPGALVEAGTVVAHLSSHFHQTLLEQTELELREARAGFEAAQSGEKSEVIAQARSEVAAARALLDQEVSEFERAKQLSETGVLSQAAYELARSEWRQAEAELEAAESRLRAAGVGEKAEIVAVYRARVDLLQQRLRDAATRAAAEAIRCPISGEVVTLQGDSALLRITSADTLYAIAPVSPSRAGWLHRGQLASLRPMPRTYSAQDGQVVSIDRHAATLAGRTFFWVTVAVPNPGRRLPPGIRGDLRFRGEKVSLLQWLFDRGRHASDRTLGV